MAVCMYVRMFASVHVCAMFLLFRMYIPTFKHTQAFSLIALTRCVIYTYIHTYTHANFMHTYIYISIHTYVYTKLLINACIYIHRTCIHTYLFMVHVDCKHIVQYYEDVAASTQLVRVRCFVCIQYTCTRHCQLVHVCVYACMHMHEDAFDATQLTHLLHSARQTGTTTHSRGKSNKRTHTHTHTHTHIHTHRGTKNPTDRQVCRQTD